MSECPAAASHPIKNADINLILNRASYKEIKTKQNNKFRYCRRNLTAFNFRNMNKKAKQIVPVHEDTLSKSLMLQGTLPDYIKLIAPTRNQDSELPTTYSYSKTSTTNEYANQNIYKKLPSLTALLDRASLDATAYNKSNNNIHISHKYKAFLARSNNEKHKILQSLQKIPNIITDSTNLLINNKKQEIIEQIDLNASDLQKYKICKGSCIPRKLKPKTLKINNCKTSIEIKQLISQESPKYIVKDHHKNALEIKRKLRSLIHSIHPFHKLNQTMTSNDLTNMCTQIKPEIKMLSQNMYRNSQIPNCTTNLLRFSRDDFGKIPEFSIDNTYKRREVIRVIINSKSHKKDYPHILKIQ